MATAILFYKRMTSGLWALKRRLTSQLMLAMMVPAGVAFADETYVGPYSPVSSNHVESGTSVLSGRLVIGSDAKLYKSGGGNLSIQEKTWDARWPATVSVGAGTVTPVSGGTDPGPVTLSDAIKAKMGLWLDASDEEHVIVDGDDVTAWYDVRETNPGSPTFNYALRDTQYSDAGKYPQKTLAYGKAALYFLGAKSKAGVTMKLNASVTKIRNSFAVIAPSNTYNGVLGAFSTGSATLYATPVATSLDDVTYFVADNALTTCWPYIANSRVYRNGVRINGTTEKVVPGRQLVETAHDHHSSNFSTSALFSERLTGNGMGGDYVHEVICFTEMLTEAERVEVETYLMRKWGIDGERRMRLTTGDGTVAALDGTVSGVEVSGSGRLVKSGDGCLTFDQRAASYDGAIEREAGSVLFKSEAPLAVSAGETVDAARSTCGDTVSVSSAAADAFVKDGAGTLVVTGFPQGVSQLRVDGGTLAVRTLRPVARVSGGGYEIPIANSSFEEYPAGAMDQGGYKIAANATSNGWTALRVNCAVISRTYWTADTVCPAMDNAKPSSWKLPGTVAVTGTKVPDGDCMMTLRQRGSVETSVAIPEPGLYELSFWFAGRGSYTGAKCELSLVGQEGQGTVSFGCTREVESGGFLLHLSRAAVTQAGTYALTFVQPDSIGVVVFDDVHLCRLADLPSGDVPVPDGDFENAIFLGNSVKTTSHGTFTNGNTLAGWTFADPEGWSSAKPSVGLTTYAMKNYSSGDLFCASRGPGHGYVQLAFCAVGGTATTAFTPAAGTWYLKADLAGRCSGANTLSAAVTVGGKTTDLGTVTVSSRDMRTYVWPIPFDSDGASAVTLDFTAPTVASKSWVIMDDVRLNAEFPSDQELVANGGFEEGSNGLDGWTRTAADGVGTAATSTRVRSYGSDQDYFGADKVEGLKFLCIYTNNVVSQDVTFPAAGVYRFSCFAHRRLKNGANSSLAVDLVRGTETNVLLVAEVSQTNFVQRTALFRVTEPGVICRLNLRRSAVKSDTMIDGVSVQRVADALPEMAGDFRETRLFLAAGSRMELGFSGTNAVRTLKLGGRSVSGVVSAETHPDYFTGPGVLEAGRDGLIILFR